MLGVIPMPPLADWVILVVTGTTLITALLSLWQSLRAGKTSNENATQIILLKHEINSRLTELLEKTAAAARLQGHQEGTLQERERPRDTSAAADARAEGLKEGTREERERPRDVPQ